MKGLPIQLSPVLPFQALSAGTFNSSVATPESANCSALSNGCAGWDIKKKKKKARRSAVLQECRRRRDPCRNYTKNPGSVPHLHQIYINAVLHNRSVWDLLSNPPKFPGPPFENRGSRESRRRGRVRRGHHLCFKSGMTHNCLAGFTDADSR